jgi:serine phosphatase RsbU (regulator of sigma subunit)
LCWTQNFGQAPEDKYVRMLENAKDDTSKVNAYIELIDAIQNEDPNKCLDYSMEAVKIANASNFKLHVVYDKISHLYISLAQYKKATDFTFLILNISKNLKGNEKYDYTGRANEKLASIYSTLKNNQLAIKHQVEAIEWYKKIKNDNYYLVAYINLANYYMSAGKIDKAIYYYEYAETNLVSQKNYDYLSYIYSGIAGCYSDNGEHFKSVEYYEKSKNAVLKYTPEDISSLAVAYSNIGNQQLDTRSYIFAVENLTKALNIFKQLDDKNSITTVYYNLANAYRFLRKYDLSNDYMILYVQLKDSIFDADTKSTIHDISIKYESEKKEQKNKILAKDNENKQLSIYYALGALLLITFILIVIFRNSRIKSRINQQLAAQNKLIEEQKLLAEIQHVLLEEKSIEITDSIKYAERIQGAILPPEKKWRSMLPNSFLLNQPKDILSGDFYWIAETDDKIFVAAADCTGHGVPGALISIVNFNLLNKAVLERGITEPSEILDAVNIWLTESLNQTTEESTIKDGMDISLISISKHDRSVKFSGANNPLYLFSDNELIEYKADRFPVGAYINEKINHFTTNDIPVKQGDTIYLFSDGFPDQFGGEKGKKYKYKQFKETLALAKDLPISEQHDFLYNAYADWRGTIEQTDDVLVIGIQL